MIRHMLLTRPGAVVFTALLAVALLLAAAVSLLHP